jgi:hypothetical protein
MSVPVDDLLGWVASLLTLITFAQTRMIALRVTAILASIFFIAYGAIGHFLPVLTLHAILLPLNSVRLAAHLGRPLAGRVMAASVLPAEVAPATTRDDDLPSVSLARRYIDA